jgi:hypothetical protein
MTRTLRIGRFSAQDGPPKSSSEAAGNRVQQPEPCRAVPLRATDVGGPGVCRAGRAGARQDSGVPEQGHRNEAAADDAVDPPVPPAGAIYNPATGVLAGRKSADGRLHDDYYFIAGLAASLRLAPEDMAQRVMDRMVAKMRELGFTDFGLGLPGNLIPVRREDYVESRQRYEGSTLEDVSDGFQNYENGGATACHAYCCIHGLYTLNRRADRERILFPPSACVRRGSVPGFRRKRQVQRLEAVG